MDGMSISTIQFLITTVIGTLATLGGFYVKAKIFEMITALEKGITEKMHAFYVAQAVRETVSDSRFTAMDIRVKSTEQSHKDITARLDELVNAIWAEHPEGRANQQRRFQGGD